MSRVSHPIPYQGSKRKIASVIFSFVRNRKYNTLFEPLVGSGAFTLFAAKHNFAKKYVLGDSLIPLIHLWKSIINAPEKTSRIYRKVWEGQKKGDFEYFNKIRKTFNESRDPVLLLYLIARCVKNAVRFNKDGNFTQSADKRRKGTNPDKMEKEILGASCLLKGKVDFCAGDFAGCLAEATRNDLVYMDPPYQGTSYGRDKRYFEQLEIEKLCDVLSNLNERGVDFLLSYDGKTGDKKHGVDLPSYLQLSRIFINAGRSSQATLNGRSETTLESLYISPKIAQLNSHTEDKEYLHNGQLTLAF